MPPASAPEFGASSDGDSSGSHALRLSGHGAFSSGDSAGGGKRDGDNAEADGVHSSPLPPRSERTRLSARPTPSFRSPPSSPERVGDPEAADASLVYAEEATRPDLDGFQAGASGPRGHGAASGRGTPPGCTRHGGRYSGARSERRGEGRATRWQPTAARGTQPSGTTGSETTGAPAREEEGGEGLVGASPLLASPFRLVWLVRGATRSLQRRP